MFISWFTERPYQDPNASWWGRTGRRLTDLDSSNEEYDPRLGSDLYHRYLDEAVAAENAGFDGVVLNEHHSTPFCMGSVINVEAAILARITDHIKICLLGNILPIWEDPLWLAETLAQIDMISEGRLVTGWVRGTGRESLAHNSQSPYNWERYQEAHDFIVKAWTDPGPLPLGGPALRLPLRQPLVPNRCSARIPRSGSPGAVSQRTVAWAAEHHYPYVMLATRLEPTRDSFAYYNKVAREFGYEAGPQHRGYLWKVHVDETEELAEEVGRKYLTRPRQHLPRRLPRRRQAPHPEPARHDRPPPPATHRRRAPRRGVARHRQPPPTTSRSRSTPPPASSPSTTPTAASKSPTASSPAPPRRSCPKSATCSNTSAPAQSPSGTATAQWPTKTPCARSA